VSDEITASAGELSVCANDEVVQTSVSESETSEAASTNFELSESDVSHAAVDKEMVHSDTANMTLEMSFGADENSEASCLLEPVVVESKPIQEPANIIVSAVDCDSTGSVSISNGVYSDCQSDELALANNDITSIAEGVLMDTD